MKRIVVRPAGISDSELISRFIHLLAEYERQPQDCRATPEAVKNQLFDRQPPAAECMIAELDKEPAGFALFFQNFSTWECSPGLYLEDFFVLPEYRGRGVGRALFERLAKTACERGCKRLEFSVLNWNQPAIDFYIKRGAAPMERWTLYRIVGNELQKLAGINE